MKAWCCAYKLLNKYPISPQKWLHFSFKLSSCVSEVLWNFSGWNCSGCYPACFTARKCAVFKPRNGKTPPFQPVEGNGQSKAGFMSLFVTTAFPAERDKMFEMWTYNSLSTNTARVKYSKHITCPPFYYSQQNTFSTGRNWKSIWEKANNITFSQRKKAKAFSERENQNEIKQKPTLHQVTLETSILQRQLDFNRLGVNNTQNTLTLSSIRYWSYMEIIQWAEEPGFKGQGKVMTTSRMDMG